METWWGLSTYLSASQVVSYSPQNSEDEQTYPLLSDDPYGNKVLSPLFELPLSFIGQVLKGSNNFLNPGCAKILDEKLSTTSMFDFYF